MANESPWQDEELLRTLYWGQGLSLAKMAEKLGCSNSTIHQWMLRHGIERQGQSEATRRACRVERATYSIDNEGYPRWASWDPDTQSTGQIKVHRLLACLDHDPHKVFAEEANCHHQSGHPLDNRPGNIEVMDRGEHTELHASTAIPECKRRLVQTATIMEEGRA